MNRASTPGWGLLGSATHWAKAWKLGIDKVQRDVGDPACGPALQKEREAKSIRLGPKKGYLWQSHPAAIALSSSHSCSPAVGLLTTLSRAPLLKEGWKVMSWAWAPGSPWIMPLDEEEKVSRQLEAGGRYSGTWVWYGRATEEPSIYQGSSSNTGLFRVRKRRMTGFPFWTRGLPIRDG